MPLTPEEERRLREKIRKELEERERRIRESKEAEEKERQRRFEERLRMQIREEEEERFYTERGYVKYINHRGGVEWLTPEEAEQRKKRRRSRKPTSRRATMKRRKRIQLAINLGIVFVALATFLYFYKFYPSRGKAVGQLVIQSDIPGARIFVDGIETAYFTPDTIKQIAAGVHYISIYKEGFGVWPPQIRVAVPKGKLAVAKFQLKNAAQMGRITLNTNVPKYSVFVDGIPQAISPEGQLDLPAGYHTVMVVKKGYRSKPNYKRILLQPGETKTLEFLLEPMEERAQVQIFSNHRDAAVYINGKFSGYLANGATIELPPDIYDITVRKNGYTPFPESETISLVDGELETLNFQLRPQTEHHTVQILTREPGATIFIDGQQLPFVTPLFAFDISAGDHFINFMRGDQEYHPGDYFVSNKALLSGKIIADF